MQRVTQRAFTLAAAAALVLRATIRDAAAVPDATADSLPRRLADAFAEYTRRNTTFRTMYGRGITAEGHFTPTEAAATVSRAPHFRNPVPATIRFSDFAGVPPIPSMGRLVSPHGIGVKFHTPRGDTDITGLSVNAFPAATGEEFLAFIDALAASPPGSPSPTVFQQYIAKHRAVARYAMELPWPADRRTVSLGKLVVTSLDRQGARFDRHLVFDPTRLIDGIGLTDDPLPVLRSATYALLFARQSRH